MRAKIKKAFQRSSMIVGEFFGKWRDYSFTYAVHSTLWWVAFYSDSGKLFEWSKERKRRYIYNYFESCHSEIIERYRDLPNDGTAVEEYPVWVFWAQGFDNAPELVQMCSRNLVKQCSNVRLLTMENISEYVDIPQQVYARVANKSMTLIHFSDILRANLLYEWGGVWVDSTCFLSRDFAPNMKGEKFVSPSSLFGGEYSWCSWNFGTNIRGNVLFGFMKDMLEAHFVRGKCMIDYLLMDYTIMYAYDNFASVREMVDNSPRVNLKRNDLHFLLNKRYDQAVYDELTKDDWVFKLSYKTPWQRYDKDGNMTFYGKLLSDNGL